MNNFVIKCKLMLSLYVALSTIGPLTGIVDWGCSDCCPLARKTKTRGDVGSTHLSYYFYYLPLVRWSWKPSL